MGGCNYHAFYILWTIHVICDGSEAHNDRYKSPSALESGLCTNRAFCFVMHWNYSYDQVKLFEQAHLLLVGFHMPLDDSLFSREKLTIYHKA